MGVTHDDVEPMTDHVYYNPWSANLETAEHAGDRDLVVAQAIDAIEHTASGNHVNLVTHGEHDHPESYLFERLNERDGISYEYVAQCGCGGQVTRDQVQ